MALVKCKDCGTEISSSAAVCIKCGKPQRQATSIWTVLRWIVIAVVVLPIGVCAYIFGSVADKVDRAERTSPELVSSTPPTPPLEVKSWKCEVEHTYIHVRGEVKNVTDRPLENIMVVGAFRDKNGTLVKSEDALVDYDPIMPGQTSPFSAGTRHNPQITDCGLSFKVLMGGTVAYTEKKK